MSACPAAKSSSIAITISTTRTRTSSSPFAIRSRRRGDGSRTTSAACAGVEKVHAARAQGHVSQIFPLQGYGFIETADGREIYFHRHAMPEHDFQLVDIGSQVFYSEEEGDEGPQASFVQLVHPHHHATHARGGQPRGETTGEEGER
jgi:cold shock CspA family protein